MITSSADIGAAIRNTRKALGVTQEDLALTAATGLRFIIDLEKGKETCRIGKALVVMATLGIEIEITSPALARSPSGPPPDRK